MKKNDSWINIWLYILGKSILIGCIYKSKINSIELHLMILTIYLSGPWILSALSPVYTYTWCKFCIHVSIQVSWIQVFWSCIPYKKLESKNLNGLGWNRNASYFSFNLDGTWMEIDQSEDRILISINLWM